MRRGVGIIAFLVGLPLLPMAARAQLAPSPDAPPVSNAPAPPPDETPAANFKVNVNLVDLFFTVRDKNQDLVPHVTRDQCQVTEDKTPQTFKNFAAQTDLPLTLGILLDTSASQTRVLPLEQDAGSQFLQHVIRQKDEAFVLSVDVKVELLQDLTNSPRLLSRALQQAQINVGGGGLGPGPVPTGDPRGTLLYDAIYQATNDKMIDESGRKALILLSDGQDQGSRTTIKGAIEAAQKANVAIYVILIADVQSYWDQGMGYYGYSAAKQLADATGGRAINVGNNGAKLQAAFQQIEDELRTQYVASYDPSNTKTDGTFRHIGLECHGDQGEDLKVQVRKGYYAPSPDN